jgi:hypothetical protein
LSSAAGRLDHHGRWQNIWFGAFQTRKKINHSGARPATRCDNKAQVLKNVGFRFVPCIRTPETLPRSVGDLFKARIGNNTVLATCSGAESGVHGS